MDVPWIYGDERIGTTGTDKHSEMCVQGERLSHAVGCAFAICLEKKRKREAETAAFQAAQALATVHSSGRTTEE